MVTSGSGYHPGNGNAAFQSVHFFIELSSAWLNSCTVGTYEMTHGSQGTDYIP